MAAVSRRFVALWALEPLLCPFMDTDEQAEWIASVQERAVRTLANAVRQTNAGGWRQAETRANVYESRSLGARQVKGSQHHRRGGPEAASPDSY
jgi:ribosome modulation factor